MTFFLLMRHGQPDFSGLDKWNARGWPADIAPLAAAGEEQVRRQFDRIAEFAPEIIVSSPVTRSLHTALLVLPRVNVPCKVEFDLHDWVADLSLQRLTLEEMQRRGSEFDSRHGEWPPGETRPWETNSAMRARVLGVLSRYLTYRRVLAVFHNAPIRAVAAVADVGMAEIVPFELKGLTSPP